MFIILVLMVMNDPSRSLLSFFAGCMVRDTIWRMYYPADMFVGGRASKLHPDLSSCVFVAADTSHDFSTQPGEPLGLYNQQTQLGGPDFASISFFLL